MQLIQTPSRVFVCEFILAFQIGIGSCLGLLLSQATFFESANDFLNIDYPMILKTSTYSFSFSLLYSLIEISYQLLTHKSVGLRFNIDHLGIHYGEIDEMESIAWHRFVGMQMNGSGPFQHVIVFALNQKTPLVIELKAFNFTQREKFKQVLKQKIRFYCPELNHRYIPELAY